MAATPKQAELPLDAATSWPLADGQATTQLLTVVAAVLGLDRGRVRPHDSFRELGGDEESAAQVREACMRVGMDVKEDDILRCATLAELQQRVTPCARQSRPIDT